MIRRFTLICLLGMSTVTAATVEGQRVESGRVSSFPATFTVKAGTSRLDGRGDVFDTFRRELGIEGSAFNSSTLEVTLSVRVLSRAEVFVGGAFRPSQQVETRAAEDLGGHQTTHLGLRPGLHAGVRASLFDTAVEGSRYRANPYVSFGAGRGSYRLRQSGQFVERSSQETFEADFRDRNSYVHPFLGIGVDVAIARQLGVIVEARQDFGSVEPGGDFSEFKDLGLSVRTFALGVRWRRT